MIRKYENRDLEFYKYMAYEAVFWDKSKNPPSFEDAQSLDFIQVILKDWTKREGDIGLVALDGHDYMGAAWVRYWNDDTNIRGYYKKDVPVLVIAISEAYRGKGLGLALINKLIKTCQFQGIREISLCVSKHNYAEKLYVKSGFKHHIDLGDSWIMTQKILP